MPDLNYYRGQSESEYMPQYLAEKTSADAGIQNVATQQREVDPYYKTLLDSLSERQVKDKGQLTASMIRRGVYRSGIMTKAESNLAGTYAKLNQNVADEKTRRVQDLGGQMTIARQRRSDVDTSHAARVTARAQALYDNWLAEERQAQLAREQIAASERAARYSGGGYSGNNNTAPEMMSATEYAQQLINKGYDWGTAAGMVESEYGTIPPGGAVDQIFRRHWIGAETDYQAPRRNINQSPGRSA